VAKQLPEKFKIVPQGLPDKMRRDAKSTKALDDKASFMSELKLRPPKKHAFAANCKAALSLLGLRRG
jgi:hypothetical protein